MSGVRWSAKELAFLAAHPDWTAPRIAAALGRTPHSVRHRRRSTEPGCSVDGCQKPHSAKGLCDRHYHKANGYDSRPKDRTTHRALVGRLALDQGVTLTAPTSLPYRVLVRSCKRCGELVTTPVDRLRRDSGPAPKCTGCYERTVARIAAYAKREQGATLPGARRHGLQWTGPELELAARDDLTVRQIAELLGRTYMAVNAARSRMRDDPKWRDVAGVDRHGVKMDLQT